eukprot:12941834-Alexandrium_andersonii.AAC.1
MPPPCGSEGSGGGVGQPAGLAGTCRKGPHYSESRRAVQGRAELCTGASLVVLFSPNRRST